VVVVVMMVMMVIWSGADKVVKSHYTGNEKSSSRQW